MDRLRLGRYLQEIRTKPCLICGSRAEAHHIQYAQPRALAKKTGDQWSVPLCHSHHMDLHQSPMPEKTWWSLHGIDPMKWADHHYNQWVKDNGDLDDE